MRRVVLAAVVCGLVSTAHANPPWTVKLPDGWTDYTAQATNLPAVTSIKQRSAQEGAHLDVWVYCDAAGDELMITFTTLQGGDPERAVLEDMLDMGRTKMKTIGAEVSYNVEWGPKLAVSTQKLRGATSVTVKGFAGFGLSGTLLSVFARCSGNEPACDAALTGLAIDSDRFHPLDSLEDMGEGMSAGRIGKIVGGVSMMALCGLIALKRRKSAAAR